MPLVAGVDLGGTVVNYTLLAEQEQFLIQGLCEYPSRSRKGPEVCLQQIVDGLELAVVRAGIRITDVAVVGLDTPGPASAEGVLSARGSTNFVHGNWAGFDIRGKLADKLGNPVTYLNDGNAAALWGHSMLFGPSARATSVSAVIGQGSAAALSLTAASSRAERDLAAKWATYSFPMRAFLGSEG